MKHDLHFLTRPINFFSSLFPSFFIFFSVRIEETPPLAHFMCGFVTKNVEFWVYTTKYTYIYKLPYYEPALWRFFLHKFTQVILTFLFFKIRKSNSPRKFNFLVDRRASDFDYLNTLCYIFHPRTRLTPPNELVLSYRNVS